MIHKNERSVCNMQAQAISARSLILATLEIQQAFIHHDLEIFPEFWIYLLKDSMRFGFKFIHRVVGLDRSGSQWIYIDIPGTHAVDSQPLPASFIDALRRRDN